MTRHSGFTLIELMVVVAVIAILSLMAVPSLRDRLVRQQVVEALETVAFAQNAVGARHVLTGEFPADNDAAGLPPPDKVVGRHLASATVADGALVLEFGAGADGALRGRRLSLRPAHVPDYPEVPVVWLCAGAAVPPSMVVQGNDLTTIDRRYLPLRCQPPPAGKAP